MKIDDQLILKLEKLSRLRLQNEERAEIKKDIGDILDMVDKLKEVNTEGVEPLIYINEEEHVLRQDLVVNELPVDQALKNASTKKGHFFKVPKVK